MVFAQGLTLDEFREAVRRAYAGYLHDPQVAVALKDFEHPYFVAGGEVGKPGKYELRGNTTIMEAVEIAGGFTHEAKHSQVLLFRRVNDDLVEARVFNLKKMLKERRSGRGGGVAAGRSGVCSAKFHFEDRAVSDQTSLKHVRESHTVLTSNSIRTTL